MSPEQALRIVERAIEAPLLPPNVPVVTYEMNQLHMDDDIVKINKLSVLMIISGIATFANFEFTHSIFSAFISFCMVNLLLIFLFDLAWDWFDGQQKLDLRNERVRQAESNNRNAKLSYSLWRDDHYASLVKAVDIVRKENSDLEITVDNKGIVSVSPKSSNIKLELLRDNSSTTEELVI